MKKWIIFKNISLANLYFFCICNFIREIFLRKYIQNFFYETLCWTNERKEDGAGGGIQLTPSQHQKILAVSRVETNFVSHIGDGL